MTKVVIKKKGEIVELKYKDLNLTGEIVFTNIYNFQKEDYNEFKSFKELLGEFSDIAVHQLPKNTGFEFYLNNELHDIMILPFYKLIIFYDDNETFYVRFFGYMYSAIWGENKWTLDYFIQELEKFSEKDEYVSVNLIKEEESIDEYTVTVIFNNEYKILLAIERSIELIKKIINNTRDKIDRVVNFKMVLNVWNKNKKNKDEKYWQNIINRNSWIISQALSLPEIFFIDEAYLGGKSLNDNKGKYIDFIYQNILSRNLTLIEIKTPETKLLNKKKYRDTYSVSSELSGSIIQLLDYKENFYKNYYSLKANSEQDFELFSPKLLLIVGNLENLITKEEKYSFDIFRRELRTIQIITFDELFKKIELIIKLMK